VPVGKDQEQHLELSRNIAARFNRQFNKEYFVHPEPLYTETPKVLSLADPTRKMSKSLGEKHYVNLFGDADRIRKQVRSAVTDTGEKTEIMSAGVSNLFELLKACEKLDARQSLLDDYNSGVLKYADLKEAVADALVELTQPLKEKLADIQADKKNVKSQIQDSSAEIRKRAIQTLKDVKELTGLAIQRNY
jgi:tryptophanyl-tRNA synthetase